MLLALNSGVFAQATGFQRALFRMSMKNRGNKSASRGVGASRPVACAGTRKSAGRFSIMNLENEDEKLATTLHEAAERGQHREIVRHASSN